MSARKNGHARDRSPFFLASINSACFAGYRDLCFPDDIYILLILWFIIQCYFPALIFLQIDELKSTLKSEQMMYLQLMVLKSGHPMTECFRSLFGKFVAALNTIYLFCLWGILAVSKFLGG